MIFLLTYPFHHGMLCGASKPLKKPPKPPKPPNSLNGFWNVGRKKTLCRVSTSPISGIVGRLGRGRVSKSKPPTPPIPP